ncbi:MAG: DUF177 domain-containing protein [Vicinamibacterales bacterium]
MQLDLSRFRGDSDHLDRTFDPSSFDLSGDEFALLAPVHLVADLRKDGRKFRLQGRVTTTLECACSRCLEPFPVLVDASPDLLFLPATDNADGTGEEREVREDDLGVSYYRHDTLDLGEVLREQFYLALPMKPLCREDCQGLCPVCGINRNRETCTCQTTWVDPRMDALRKLRGDD